MNRNTYVLLCSPGVGRILSTLNSNLAKKDSINNYFVKDFIFDFSSTSQVNIKIEQDIFSGIILASPITLGVFKKSNYLFERENQSKIVIFLFSNIKSFKKSFQWFKIFIFKPILQENFLIITEKSFSYLFDRKKKFDSFKN
jgi:hypothetical protein